MARPRWRVVRSLGDSGSGPSPQVPGRPLASRAQACRLGTDRHRSAALVGFLTPSHESDLLTWPSPPGKDCAQDRFMA